MYKRTYRVTTREFDPKLVCGHCNQILHEPIQTLCGHRFCKDHQDILSDCPECGETLNDGSEDVYLFPDRYIEREVGELDVECNKCHAMISLKQVHQIRHYSIKRLQVRMYDALEQMFFRPGPLARALSIVSNSRID